MITTLHIKNIGIIDEITINLNEGFNVLTGETGAGKTLIIDSLNIICGARFSKDMIRKGESYSLVEACLYLPNSKISEDGNVIVTREVYDSGKNLCKINGRLVTVSELREFMKYHIDIHGQFDNQYIMEEENHITYLDEYSKDEIESIKSEYMVKYNEYTLLKQSLKDNLCDEKERQRTLDLLKYELNEIDSASLTIGEEEILKRRSEVIKNAERINGIFNFSKTCLEENVRSNLDEVIRNISKLVGIDEEYKQILDRLEESYYNIIDVSEEISDKLDDVGFDEEEAKNIVDRMDIIHSLKRKYGRDIEEILEYRDKIKEKIEEIENSEERRNKINSDIAVVKDKMKDLCVKMNSVRVKNAKKLENKINSAFRDLEMVNSNIKIEVTLNIDEKYSINGLDNVRFLICTNKGEDFKALNKIASGGEISRIVLAIKSACSEINGSSTCIFDEIDTGISGKAAKAVGLKLKQIAKYHQVICVTHLAPVAAASDYHYFISKSLENGEKTVTNIKLLDNDEALNELARISSGNVTEISLKYALELRNLVFAV